MLEHRAKCRERHGGIHGPDGEIYPELSRIIADWKRKESKKNRECPEDFGTDDVEIGDYHADKRTLKSTVRKVASPAKRRKADIKTPKIVTESEETKLTGFLEPPSKPSVCPPSANNIDREVGPKRDVSNTTDTVSMREEVYPPSEPLEIGQYDDATGQADKGPITPVKIDEVTLSIHVPWTPPAALRVESLTMRGLSGKEPISIIPASVHTTPLISPLSSPIIGSADHPFMKTPAKNILDVLLPPSTSAIRTNSISIAKTIDQKKRLFTEDEMSGCEFTERSPRPLMSPVFYDALQLNEEPSYQPESPVYQPITEPTYVPAYVPTYVPTEMAVQTRQQVQSPKKSPIKPKSRFPWTRSSREKRKAVQKKNAHTRTPLPNMFDQKLPSRYTKTTTIVNRFGTRRTTTEVWEYGH
jgi:hypothetical protein